MNGTLMVGRAVKSSTAAGVESLLRFASPAVAYWPWPRFSTTRWMIVS